MSPWYETLAIRFQLRACSDMIFTFGNTQAAFHRKFKLISTP
jgi:hypothetical protein